MNADNANLNKYKLFSNQSSFFSLLFSRHCLSESAYICVYPRLNIFCPSPSNGVDKVGQ